MRSIFPAAKPTKLTTKSFGAKGGKKGSPTEAKGKSQPAAKKAPAKKAPVKKQSAKMPNDKKKPANKSQQFASMNDTSTLPAVDLTNLG